MAAWLAGQEHPADWLITSAAARARRTAGFVQQGFDIPDDHVDASDTLYGADPETLLAAIRQAPPDTAGVAIVAHNPGMTWMVNLMLGDTYLDNLPTFGVVALAVPRPWAELAFGTGSLRVFMSPKRLPD